MSVAEQLAKQYHERMNRPSLAEMVREAYQKWVTIGANKSAPDGSKGGTPVELDEAGNIVSGPGRLEGHNVKSLPGGKNLFGETNSGAGRQGRLDFQPEERKTPPASDKAKWGENVKHLPDGRVVGNAMLSADDIQADPERFQFKVSGIGDEGVTEELKEVKKFRPEFAGQLLVWKDPANGQTYVVNGHHRHELAKRTGYAGKIPVFAVDAKDAKEARAFGALANIAEGRGTAVDAAKFMRDMGVGVDDIREHGISLKGRVADEGAALSKLSDKLFRSLINEDLRESRAIAIARELGDKPDFQDKLAKIIDGREAKGRKLADDTVAEMAREMAETPTVKESHTDLFGSWEDEDSLFVERNELKAFVKSQLSEERRTFKSVSKRGRDERLAEAGNVLDSEKNKQIATKASEDFDVFEKFANLKGPISHALNTAAAELRANPKQAKSIRNRLAREIREQIRLETADAGAKESFARALRGDSGAAEGGRIRIDGSAESIVERFSRVYGELGYPVYRPTPSVREMVLRAYHGHVVERYGKAFDESKVNRDEGGKFAEKPGQKQKGLFGDEYKPKKEPPKFENKGGKQQNLFSGLQALPGQMDLFDDLDSRNDSHESLKNLFSKSELATPVSASHQHRTKEAAYDAAKGVKADYDQLMDEGQGVEKAIGATTRRNSQPGEWDAMLDQFEAGTTKGPIVVLAPIKGEKRALEKVDKYKGDWGRMKDLVRGTIAVDSLVDIKPTIEAVRKEMEARGWTHAERPNDRFSNPTDEGYRDVQISLRSPDGLICELQINTKRMLAAKEKYGHEMYEEFRSIDEAVKNADRKPTPEESERLKTLSEQMTKLYGGVWEKENA